MKPARDFSPAEDAVIVARYALYGAVGCALPGRTVISIMLRAGALGIARDPLVRHYYAEADSLARRIVANGVGLRSRVVMRPNGSIVVFHQVPGGAVPERIEGTVGIYSGRVKAADLAVDLAVERRWAGEGELQRERLSSRAMRKATRCDPVAGGRLAQRVMG